MLSIESGNAALDLPNIFVTIAIAESFSNRLFSFIISPEQWGYINNFLQETQYHLPTLRHVGYTITATAPKYRGKNSVGHRFTQRIAPYTF